MRARAVAVKRSAAMVSLGQTSMRLSSVMVPTTTTVRLSSLAMLDAMRERETGGRLVLDINRRRRTTLLKLASVRPNDGKILVSNLLIPSSQQLIDGSIDAS